MTKEMWVDVPEFENLYEVNSMGEFRSKVLRTGGKIKALTGLKLKRNHDGYMIVRLSKDKKQHHKSVHRIVATCFVPNPKMMPQINHKNFNKKDNRADNLEWCSPAQNVAHLVSNRNRSDHRKGVKDVLVAHGLYTSTRKGDPERKKKYRKAYKRAKKLGII